MHLFLLYTFSALGVLFVLFRCYGSWLGRKKFEEAQEKERSGSYAEACYAYASAILNGAKVAPSKNRIAELWNVRGPFHYGDYPQSATHHAILLIIANTLSEKNGPPVMASEAPQS